MLRRKRKKRKTKRKISLTPSKHVAKESRSENRLPRLKMYSEEVCKSIILTSSSYEDTDSSEDEGLADYKIGGYHPMHVGEVLINRYLII
jgi:hypothetical protein